MGSRFSNEVIEATSEAISLIKRQYKTIEIELVGYAGGAAVAALVAAARSDVTRVITVAGNLNHSYWTQLHRVTPLGDSQNPVDYAKQLEATPQLHFVGGRDSTVPKSVVESYVEVFPDSTIHTIQVIRENGHNCCWEGVSAQF